MSKSGKKLDPDDRRLLYIVIFVGIIACGLLLLYALGGDEKGWASFVSLAGVAGLLRYMFWKNHKRWW